MILPANETELAEVIAGATGPLRVMGGGTRAIGALPDAEPLSARALTGITLYEPGALTLVAGAGTPVYQIEATLNAQGQRLAFEPMDHRVLLGTDGTPTLGGIVAANVSGPRRIQVGACRDSVLGVRFVDGQGRVLKNGGRVMKNVTGYDLVKLMTGSWGTLGVISEVSIKVQAKPETAACVLLYGLDEDAAINAMCAALGSPYDLTGAAHAPVGVDGHPVTMLRLEGLETSVAYRAEKLKDMFTGAAPEIHVERDQGRIAAGWKWVRDAELFSPEDGNIWRFSVKPTGAPGLVNALRARYPDLKVLYDWGGGLVWVATTSAADLRAGLQSGHATLMRRGPAVAEKVETFHPEQAAVAALAKGLRAQFDPRGILNPGLMG